MDPREAIIAGTQRSVEDLFRAAKAVQTDKLSWKPLDNGRSALDIVAECALSPAWGASLLEKREFNPEPDMFEKFKAAKAAISSIDEAEGICNQNMEKLFAAIRAFPVEDLGKTIHLPFGPSHDWSFTQIMSLQMWNCIYHLGQVNYIQTLYGDFESH